MSRLAANLRNVARRLAAYEAVESTLPERSARTELPACEKLREPLAQLWGIDGVRALFMRAVALAGAEVSWLRGVRIRENASLELPKEQAKLDQKEITNGEVALVAELLGLLVTFIGEPLTLSFVQEIWPRAHDLDLNDKESKESTKKHEHA